MLSSYALKLPMIKAYDKGAQTADTDDILDDIPQLSTLKRAGIQSDDTDYLRQSESSLPTEIKVRLTLKPIDIPSLTVTAQLKQDTHLLQTCRFYHMESLHRDMQKLHYGTLWSGVDLSYEGTAFYYQHSDERPLLPTQPLFELAYQKDQMVAHYNFVLPDQAHYFQTNVHYKKNYCITHFDDQIQGINISPFIPYGGYIEQPINVNAVCQTYALLSEAPHNRTQLVLYTQHYCNKNGIKLSIPYSITPFRLAADTKYLPTIQLTLGGWLLLGYLKITVNCKATNTPHVYCSKSFKQADLNTQTVDVMFLRQQGDES